VKQRILIVEDDAGLAGVLTDNLTFEGFQVQAVGDGLKAVTLARTFAPDLAIVDVMVPGKNGFDLCRLWREGRRVPIILLTAKSNRQDKILGLQLGADDYVTKPFDLQELIARVHAVLRRVRPSIPRLSIGRVTVDFGTLRAWRGSSVIELSHREFALLRYLAERQNAVVDREELLHALWEFAESPHTRAVDHAIVRLRRKVEDDPHDPKFIQTVHGGGYTLTLNEPIGPAARR
jgi:DNA-binding response OmpR family regulator